MATKSKRTKTSSKKKSTFRASWKGQLRFGLVSFEVEAVNVQSKENAEIHFHLLHKPDHERIHYAKVCPKHGEVTSDEIIEGFEYKKGKYIEIEKEELDELRTQKERSLSIDAFVSGDEIDPIYFDGRMYYLLPSGESANEPYVLLLAAMEKTGRWGVGQVVFSGREQLAVVRPVAGVLTMAMLNYDAEIRKSADMKREFSRPAVTTRKLQLAEQLIGKWHEGKFDLSDYKDRYREKVKKALDAKKRGVEIPTREEDEPEVINLMEALQRSVEGLGGKQGHTSPAKKRSTRRGRRRA